MSTKCATCNDSGVISIQGSYFRGTTAQVPCECQDHKNMIRLGDECSPTVKRVMEKFWKRLDEIRGGR